MNERQLQLSKVCFETFERQTRYRLTNVDLL